MHPRFQYEICSHRYVVNSVANNDMKIVPVRMCGIYPNNYFADGSNKAIGIYDISSVV